MALALLVVATFLLHFLLHIPLLAAVIIFAILWLVWKLKYVILAVVGLEMLLDRE